MLDSVAASAHKFIAHPDSDAQAAEIEKRFLKGSAIVLVGPEGGFTEEEVGLAAMAGFNLLNLGGRRLRAETAAAAALGYLLARSGEWQT